MTLAATMQVRKTAMATSSHRRLLCPKSTKVAAAVPAQAPSDPTITWEETRVSGPEPLAVRVGKKLRNEEALITEYSGARLRMDLDRVPLLSRQMVPTMDIVHDRVALEVMRGCVKGCRFCPRLGR